MTLQPDSPNTTRGALPIGQSSRVFRLRHPWTLAAILVALAAVSQSQTIAQPGPLPAAAGPTLADSLKAATTLTPGRVVLAVSAEKTHLLPRETDPRPDAALVVRAAAFGQIVQTFGSVTAIAPRTMVLLNQARGDPDPAAGVSPRRAMQLLLGTLNPAQWQRLTDKDGLGYGDLVGSLQRGLFRSVLPPGKLQLMRYETADWTSPFYAGKVSDADTAAARLRLTRSLTFEVPSEGAKGTFLQVPARMGAGYSLAIEQENDTAALAGLQTRIDAPNVPKQSQLNLDSPLFQVAIPLDGLDSVGALIGRIRDRCHVELYADARYESLSLTQSGIVKKASASDLLRATALCVTGAYRVVGPAVVVTHDLEGVGVELENLAEYGQRELIGWNTLEQQARAAVSSDREVMDLAPDPNSIDLTPEQKTQHRDALRASQPLIMASLADLSTDQQATVQNWAAANNKAADQRAADALQQGRTDNMLRADLSGSITLRAEPAVDVLFPSLPVPADASRVLTAFALLSRNPIARPEAPDQQAPHLAPLFQQVARRGVLIAPASNTALDADLASMRRLGLNELWLVVFSAGLPWTSDRGPSGEGLLRHAVEACRDSGIRVLPVLDLLDWGPGAPPQVRDRSILGEESPEAWRRYRMLTRYMRGQDASPAPPGPVVVSPFVARVGDSLVALIRDVAGRPGIAGLVWRMTAPPGYLEPLRPNPFHSGPLAGDLGYHQSARIGFLRQFHTDPIDIDPGRQFSANVDLPGFDDPDLDRSLAAEWRQYRQDADRRLLDRLVAAAESGPIPVPILFEVPGPSGWYGSWDNLRTPPPGKSIAYTGGIDQLAAAARQQSKVAIIGFYGRALKEPELLANMLPAATAWSGCVLDYDPSDDPTLRTDDPLAALPP